MLTHLVDADAQHILDTITDGVMVVDELGRVLYANPSACRILQRDNLVGRNCGLPVVEGDETVDVQLVRPGELGWAQLRSSPVHWAEQPASVLTLTDITGRKQAEYLLRIAAAAFEAQAGIMVTDANQVILRVNQAFTRITGYSATEAVGQKPSLLSSGRHDKVFYQSMWHSVIHDGFWSGEVWDKRKNGEEFPIWLTNTAVMDNTGLIAQYVGTFTDITLQKQAEKVLLDARQVLEKQIGSTMAELGKTKEEVDEANVALNVLLKHQRKSLSDAQQNLSKELRETVFPFLVKLKRSGLQQNQAFLVGAIEANLQQATTTYGQITQLPSVYQQLTPTEIQVASLIRQGLPTKAIASTLSLSAETISVHRKHIRKKLGLGNNATNLRSYLLAMAD